MFWWCHCQRVIHRYMGALLALLDAREIVSAKIDFLLSITNHK